jgi:hypothetical protein
MISAFLQHAPRKATLALGKGPGGINCRSMSKLAQELANMNEAAFDALSSAEQSAFVDRIGPLIEAELGSVEDIATRAASDTLNTLSQPDTWQHLTTVAPALRSAAAAAQDSGATPAYHHVRFSGKEDPTSWYRGALTADFLPTINARREAEASMRNAMETRLSAAIRAKQHQAGELLLSVVKAAGGKLPATDGKSVLACDAVRGAVDAVAAVEAKQGSMPRKQHQNDLVSALSQALATFKGEVGVQVSDTSRDGVLRDAFSRLVALQRSGTSVPQLVAAQMAKMDQAAAAQRATAAGGELDPTLVQPTEEHLLHEHSSFEQYKHSHLSMKQLLSAVSHKRLPSSIEGVAMPELQEAARVLEENSTYGAQDVAEMMQFASSMVQGGGDDGVVVDADSGIWASKADIEAVTENTDPDVPPADPTGELDILKGAKPEQLWKVDFPLDRTVTSPELYGDSTEQLFRDGTSRAGDHLAGELPTMHPLRKNIVPTSGSALPESFLGVPTEIALHEHFGGDADTMRAFISFVNESEEAKIAARAGAGSSKYVSRRKARVEAKSDEQR